MEYYRTQRSPDPTMPTIQPGSPPDTTLELGWPYPVTYRRAATDPDFFNLTISVQGVDTEAPSGADRRLRVFLESKWHNPADFTVPPTMTTVANPVGGACWEVYVVTYDLSRDTGNQWHYDIALPVGSHGGHTGARLVWAGITHPVNSRAWMAADIIRTNEVWEALQWPVEWCWRE